MSVAENIETVRKNIAEAALRSGRKPEDILLVAATKTQTAEVAAGNDDMDRLLWDWGERIEALFGDFPA